MIPQQFAYIRATSLDEAIRLLAENGGEAKLLAGGHSLLPMMKLRLAAPSLLIDIGRIPELSGVKITSSHVEIGAGMPHAYFERDTVLADKFPIFSMAAHQIADPAVRNYGTIGGSLVHADPSADWPAVMLAADAEFELLSTRGIRTVAARDFFLGPLVSAAAEDEVLTIIRVPRIEGRVSHAYRKFRHTASGYAVAAAAVMLRWQGSSCSGGAIAITGVAGQPFRTTLQVENLLVNHRPKDYDMIATQALAGIEPLEDRFADGPYRLNLGRAMLQRALTDAAQNIRSIA